LPDGLFLDQKSQFGYILEYLGMGNVIYTYSGHLEYFTTFGYILRAFGNYVVILFIFFCILYQERSGNPAAVCRK
jgi:tellurite resistance protein TehA-like permease